MPTDQESPSPPAVQAPSLHYRPHRDPKSSHQQILSLVRGLGRQPILDVGAAQGMLGQGLSAVAAAGLPALAIDAVEPNVHWAQAAEPYYRRVFPTTIEGADLPPKSYRVIVCADVLEHTVDPVAVLQQLGELATDDAAFIISLPNVAHLAVRLMLLTGRFPPMERGILDKTHLHFYTRATAVAMVESAGLAVEKVTVTGVPLDELWPRGEGKALFNFARRLQHAMLWAAPTIFGFQCILVARKK